MVKQQGLRRHLNAALIAVLCVAGISLLARKQAEDPDVYVETRFLMDTLVVISVAHPDREAAKVAVGGAFDELTKIDEMMARKEGTPLWELNEAGGGTAPVEIVEVVEAALEGAGLTVGAFDPTLAGLIDLWKVKEGPHAPPSAKEVEEALAATGWERVRLEKTPNGGSLSLYSVKLDLGGIGKGYGVDLAAASLTEAGFSDFIVNAGGDLSVSGDKKGKPWRVGIQHPRKSDEVFAASPQKGALITSGDYERYFEWEGKRYHHILSPVTGHPARTGCVSVTVWADTALRADMLATAAFVLGPEEGLKLLESQQGVEGMIIDEKLNELVTTAFDEKVIGDEGR